MDLKKILKELHQINSAYIEADKLDDDDMLEALEEQMIEIKELIVDNKPLGNELSVLTEMSDKKLLRKLKLEQIKEILNTPRVAVLLEDADKNNLWYLDVVNDTQLWNERILDCEIHLVVHEYSRLKNLFEEGQTFGVLLEVKDIFEVLLKLPTLVFASYYFHLKERTLEQNKVLMQLVSKPISLGDWQLISGQITKDKSIDSSNPILKILISIVKIYQKHNIVSWRNNEIGHGALKLETDQKFIDDIVSKVKILKEFFDECEENFLAINVDRQNASIKVYGVSYSLSPYIYFVDDIGYYFDSYYSRRVRAYGLDYMKGRKETCDKLYQEINKYIVKEKKQGSLLKTEASIGADAYKSSVVEVIDKISEIKETVEPDYLQKWIKNSLDSYSKGVFILEAERGMGKSIFCRMLDEDSLCKIKIPNLISKAYYVNDSYRSSLNTFVQETRHNLGHYHGERLLLNFDLSSDSVTPEIFADYLNKIKLIYADMVGNPDIKFLYIIDGLDEIKKPKENETQKTVFNLIPDSDLLEEGVYILLTNRTKDEITSYTENKFLAIQKKASFLITRKSQENINVLRSFVYKYILKDENQENIESILTLLYDKADYRMLHMYMIKELLTIGNVSIDNLPNTEDLFDFYLKNLENKYGEKYFQHIIQLLIIMATQYEELTISEISYLVGEEGLSFKLLAFMLDLRGLIKSERDIRGNKYSLAHYEIKEKIKNNIHAKTVITEVLSPVHSLLDCYEQVGDLNDGESYLLGYALNYHTSLTGSLLEYDENKIGNLERYYTLAIYLSNNSNNYIKRRANEIYMSISYIESDLEKSLYIKAILSYRIAINYFDMDNIASSYDAIKETINLLDSLQTKDSNAKYAYEKYGISKKDFWEAKDFYVHVALRSGDFNSALEIGHLLINEDNVLKELKRPQRLYLNMAKIYLNKYMMDDAFLMFNQSRGLCIDEAEGLHIDIEIAKTHRKNGNVKKSKELLEELLENPNVKNSILESESKIQYGLCCFSDKNYVLAHQYYMEADELLKKLNNKEIQLYNWLGISTIYEFLEPARIDEGKELLETILRESKEYGFINFYIDSMNGLARKYLLLQNFDKAIYFAKKGAALWKMQGASGGLLVMYSHIINACIGKYFIEGQNKQEIENEVAKYTSLGEDLTEVVTEKVLLEIFKSSKDKWKTKTLGV